MEDKQVYEFSVGSFQGPFDVLLDLAKQQEIEITEISLDTLIDQYLDFIAKVQERGLDLQSVYLEMAAELLRLKSVSLLHYNAELELELEEEILIDRQKIIERLLEYKKYKEIVKDLNQLVDERSNYLMRPADRLLEYREDNFKVNFDVNLFFKATQNYLLNLNTKEEEKQITIKELSIEEYIQYLKSIDKPISLTEVIKNMSKAQYVCLFLGMLESLKHGYIQAQVNDDLEITILPGGVDD